MTENVFSSIARKATTLSPIMAGREKIQMDELINQYPGGVTIGGFDIITTNADSFPVFVFFEDPQKFAFGGTILHNIIDEWVSNFDGDIEKCSSELEKSGGVKLKFYKSRTKSGNNVTLVEVL